MDFSVLNNPPENELGSSALYYLDAHGPGTCLITGGICGAISQKEGDEEYFDCRNCNIPLVAAICRLSQTIGANGRE